MKLTRKLFIIILPLCIATAFILPKLSPLCQLSLYEFSSNRVFVNSVFNAVILAILAKDYKPLTNGTPPFLFESEMECQNEDGDDRSVDSGSAKSKGDIEDKREAPDDDDDDNDDDEESDGDIDHYGSDGYDEDDDDTGSDGDIGWEDDDIEEFDDLRSRSEAFIAKVINGWKEEKKSENYQDRNWAF